MAIPYGSVPQILSHLTEMAYARTDSLEVAVEERATLFAKAEAEEGRGREKAIRSMDIGVLCGFTYLSKIFQLTEFEQHCFRLALAVEVDSELEKVYAQNQDGVCRLPTLTLCLNTFSDKREEQTKAIAQWRRDKEVLKLLFTAGIWEAPLQSALTVGLKLSPRVVNFCLSPTQQEKSWEGLAERFLPSQRENAPLVVHGALVEKLTDFMTQRNTPTLYHIHGDDGVGKRTLTRHVVGRNGRSVMMFHLPAIFKEVGWEGIVCDICRELAMTDAIAAFSGMDTLLSAPDMPSKTEDGIQIPQQEELDCQRFLRELLLQVRLVSSTVFLLSRCAWNPALDPQPYTRVDVPLAVPEPQGRMALLQHYFEEIPMADDINFEDLGTKFTLTAGQIAQAARDAKHHMVWDGAEILTAEGIHRACREQLSHNLGKMATLVPAVYQWDDLILPKNQKQMLANACAQVEHRHRVYYTWGFDKKRAYGRGLSMLFSGPPGTGKTMAAQVVANRLHLDLYKVDVSSVMSKYIGETEKQLGAVFDEVKKSQSILFFDEADAIFGKRSETKDSHDRYANVQTSYLLQKMEEYDGIVVLASNYQENFDEAFKRRITFIIDFTLPDQGLREQIWRSVIPPDLPLGEDVDMDFLARSFELSGSSIKNVALSAAFLAAQEDSHLSMNHLLLATRAEQQKAGKLLHREDYGEYYHHIEPYL